jgi:hypothetical protein
MAMFREYLFAMSTWVASASTVMAFDFADRAYIEHRAGLHESPDRTKDHNLILAGSAR